MSSLHLPLLFVPDANITTPGLVPSWTKRSPDYGSYVRLCLSRPLLMICSIRATINCRDDSLLSNTGMWNSMKKTKRCIVLAEGFFEWQKKGKDKVVALFNSRMPTKQTPDPPLYPTKRWTPHVYGWLMGLRDPSRPQNWSGKQVVHLHYNHSPCMFPDAVSS